MRLGKSSNQLPQFTPLEIPPCTFVERESIRNLLQKEPVHERFDSVQKFHLEFMSYLRPVLKEEVFYNDNDGWCFLTKHVQSNDELFKNILAERNR